MTQASNHSWSFSKVGGVKRVNLESGADLKHLDQLDQKLWTALSCPTHGLETDAKTLALLDSDGDGQIRVPEILQAVQWMCAILKDPNDLLKQAAVFPLSAINTDTEEGKYLLHCARIVLKNLGKPDADQLSVDDTSDHTRIFAATDFNGDGIVTDVSTNNAALKNLIACIMSSVGAAPDRSGKDGIGKEQADAFYLALQQHLAWLDLRDSNLQQILPFGQETDAAYKAWKAIAHKTNDYFLRCRLAAFDAEGAAALNKLTDKMEALATRDLLENLEEIRNFPLARIEAGKALPLQNGYNPAWDNEIQTFKQKVCKTKNSLSESEWRDICEQLSHYENWLLAEQGSQVAALGKEQLLLLKDEQLQQELYTLIAKDLELEDEADSMILVDKMVRYYRDLFSVLKNFVTFFDFYTPGTKANFQAGTLYIDQRSCDLCIKVSDMARHDSMVALSGMYLLYCKCSSRANGEEMMIVAAITNGDIDNLIPGRNAVFYDRKGLDWDATVVHIVENPISIRQAFWTPYRKVSRFIETQIKKFASAQDDKVTAQTTGAIAEKGKEAEAKIVQQTQVQQTATPVVVAAPPEPFDIGKFVGIFAAISLALGAIGTAIASIVAGFIALSWWKMPLAIAGILLLISGPSMIMAYLKLRKRNLAPLLDANGWAINARANVNIKFGNALTQLATLPPNARINLNDPFTKKGIPVWKLALMIAALIIALIYGAIWMGYIQLP